MIVKQKTKQALLVIDLAAGITAADDYQLRATLEALDCPTLGRLAGAITTTCAGRSALMSEIDLPPGRSAPPCEIDLPGEEPHDTAPTNT